MEDSNTNSPGLHQIDINPETEEVAPPTGVAIAEDTTTVTPLPTKPAHSKKFALVLGGIIILGVGGLGAYALLSKIGAKPSQGTSVSTTAADTTNTPASSTATLPAASSSDSAITTDLQSADTNLNQSSSDQANSDSALDDASQQVSVPTN